MTYYGQPKETRAHRKRLFRDVHRVLLIRGHFRHITIGHVCRMFYRITYDRVSSADITQGFSMFAGPLHAFAQSSPFLRRIIVFSFSKSRFDSRFEYSFTAQMYNLFDDLYDFDVLAKLELWENIYFNYLIRRNYVEPNGSTFSVYYGI